jgi:hypothetical protein
LNQSQVFVFDFEGRAQNGINPATTAHEPHLPDDSGKPALVFRALLSEPAIILFDHWHNHIAVHIIILQCSTFSGTFVRG